MLARKPGEEAALPAHARHVARSFRYMRRKPTIMAYKAPSGDPRTSPLTRGEVTNHLERSCFGHDTNDEGLAMAVLAFEA